MVKYIHISRKKSVVQGKKPKGQTNCTRKRIKKEGRVNYHSKLTYITEFSNSMLTSTILFTGINVMAEIDVPGHAESW